MKIRRLALLSLIFALTAHILLPVSSAWYLPVEYDNPDTAPSASEFLKDAKMAAAIDAIMKEGHVSLYDPSTGEENLAPIGSKAVPLRVQYNIGNPRVWGGQSCFVYAWGVYYTLYGDSPGGMKNTEKVYKGAIPLPYFDGFETLHSLGVRAGYPAYMRVTNHSVVLLTYDTEGAWILQGNYRYSNGFVCLTYYTWEMFRMSLLKNGSRSIEEIYQPSVGLLKAKYDYKPGKAVTGIALNQKKLTLTEGQSSHISSVIKPKDAEYGKINWTSSNPAVASVDSIGTVKALKAGSTVISAVAMGSGHKATVSVTVKPKPTPTPTPTPKPTPTPTPTPVPTPPLTGKATMEMYRVYNPNTGEHFYTASEQERDALVNKHKWHDEGIGWIAPSSGDPVYRLYNKNGSEHHYTMSETERDALVKRGWKFESIGWYSDTKKRTKVYREYNPNARNNNHNYTADQKEHDTLLKRGWIDEGVGWYAVSAK